MGNSAETFASIWARMEKPVVGCWIWPAGKNGKGRAVFRGRSAPKIAFELFIAPLGAGEGALHSCDQPACMRLDHLFPGTQQLNMDDCRDKGRWRVKDGGEKLTGDQVIEIRRRRSTGESIRSVAKDFPVTSMQVSRISRGVQRKASAA